MSASEFITTTEAARRMGISRSTLHRKLRRGDNVPPFVLVDQRTIRWLATELDAWVAARTHWMSQQAKRGQQSVREEPQAVVQAQELNTGGGAALAGGSWASGQEVC